MKLEYVPTNPENIKEHVYMVGKGVTYDTGGADLKVNGVMAGMSRDSKHCASIHKESPNYQFC